MRSVLTICFYHKKIYLNWALDGVKLDLYLALRMIRNHCGKTWISLTALPLTMVIFYYSIITSKYLDLRCYCFSSLSVSLSSSGR